MKLRTLAVALWILPNMAIAAINKPPPVFRPSTGPQTPVKGTPGPDPWGGFSLPRPLPTVFSPVSGDRFGDVSTRNDGTAVLVFTRGAKGAREVLAADWDGTDWLTPVRVSADPFASDPRVAIDATGRAVVVWWRNDGVGATGLVSHETSPRTWSNATQFSAVGEEVMHPAIVFDRIGQRLLIGYQQRLPLGTGVVIASFRGDSSGSSRHWVSEKRVVLDRVEAGQMRFSPDPTLTLTWTESATQVGWISLLDGAWQGPYRATPE